VALITEDLRIPDIGALFPSTRRRHASKLRPCGTAAAYRRHLRRREKACRRCTKWHRLDMRLRRTVAALEEMKQQAAVRDKPFSLR
jgi:hypothetical protein